MAKINPLVWVKWRQFHYLSCQWLIQICVTSPTRSWCISSPVTASRVRVSTCTTTISTISTIGTVHQFPANSFWINLWPSLMSLSFLNLVNFNFYNLTLIKLTWLLWQYLFSPLVHFWWIQYCKVGSLAFASFMGLPMCNRRIYN